MALEVAGIQAARLVLSKALGAVSSGPLEAWAASNARPERRGSQDGAQALLNTARGRGHHQEIRNPALTELLQKLRDLGYRADDVLDELDYFRIQDELDGSYHAADEHQGSCLSNYALNARHTAAAITQNLIGFSRSHSDGHREPAERGKGGASCGAWCCLGLTRAAPSEREEDDEEEHDSRGVTCGTHLWPCNRTSAVATPNSQPDVGQNVDHDGCMGRLASGARNTIHTVVDLAPAVEARSCVTESTKFSGLCFSDTNCDNICRTEGFLNGACSSFKRNCMCHKLC